MFQEFPPPPPQTSPLWPFAQNAARDPDRYGHKSRWPAWIYGPGFYRSRIHSPLWRLANCRGFAADHEYAHPAILPVAAGVAMITITMSLKWGYEKKVSVMIPLMKSKKPYNVRHQCGTDILTAPAICG